MSIITSFVSNTSGRNHIELKVTGDTEHTTPATAFKICPEEMSCNSQYIEELYSKLELKQKTNV